MAGRWDRGGVRPMAKRKQANTNPSVDPVAEPMTPAMPGDPGRVLAVMGAGNTRTKVTRTLRDIRIRVDFVESLECAHRSLDAHEYDVLLIDSDHAGAGSCDMIRGLAEAGRVVRCVLACRKPDLETALGAMRCGASDLVSLPINKAELQERILAAVEHACRLRRQMRRVERLKRLCRRLQAAQDRVCEQVDVLYDGVPGGHGVDAVDGGVGKEPAVEQVRQRVEREYGKTIRRELDVESLLRTSLEYLLTKTGPTNAAIFLPTGHDDYSLGAYVNYDMPKDTVDVLLDHLADVVPAQFEEEASIIRLRSDREITQALGAGLGWLAGAEMTIFTCMSHGETLAVAALFRDSSKPFGVELDETLDILRGMFAEQLERVINIHNRHVPKSEWPGGEEEGEGFWGGMAA